MADAAGRMIAQHDCAPVEETLDDADAVIVGAGLAGLVAAAAGVR
jgi:hypothetical protein